MPLDLEEQEQLAALKGWWKDNANLLLGALAAALVAFAGWQGWRWYEGRQALEASALYDSLSRAAQAQDARAMREAGGTLIESYPRTLYASLGALVAARFYFDRGDLKNAGAQLQWVIERSPSEDLRDLARLRLAAVRLDEKAYDEALKLLEAKRAAAYEAQYAALKGDVLVAKGQTGPAKEAYQLALDKSGSQDAVFRESVRVRLEALGE